MAGNWERGDQIVVRDIYRGTIRSVVPVTVVEDSAQRIVLYLAIGTPFLLPEDDRGALTKDFSRTVSLKRLTWVGPEQLIIARPEDAYSVIVRWAGPERQLLEWYVNLQAPLRRTRLGFDSTDHVLDVVISPDLNHVTWKDEDHLRELVRGGYFSDEDALRFRAEGERAVAGARRREPPFGDGWDRWLPEPKWPIPGLPETWDRVDL